MRKAKPVPQTPPGTLRNGALGYAKRVASSFPNKRGVSVWREGDFYRAEWVLPSSCQEGLSGPPQGEPGLPLSIANEANGKVFTKKPPRPLPWPRSGSSILALDLPWWCKSSQNRGRAVSRCPGKKKTLIPTDAPSSLVPLEPSGTLAGGRQAKAGRQASRRRAHPHAAPSPKGGTVGRNNAAIPGIWGWDSLWAAARTPRVQTIKYFTGPSQLPGLLVLWRGIL